MTRVMVIDDEETSREIARRMFASLGVTDVLLADNGIDGLALLNKLPQPPDVILCDIFMPGKDGIEFVDALSERRFLGGLILITGGDTQYLDVARQIAQANGLRVLAALVKPLMPGPLGQALAALQRPRTG